MDLETRIVVEWLRQYDGEYEAAHHAALHGRLREHICGVMYSTIGYDCAATELLAAACGRVDWEVIAAMFDYGVIHAGPAVKK